MSAPALAPVASRSVRVVVVGGPLRGAMRLAGEAELGGVTLEWHDGDTAGTGVRSLRSLIRRADLVVITTDVNSHRGVEVAKQEARRAGRAYTLVRSVSGSRVRDMLAAMSPAAA